MIIEVKTRVRHNGKIYSPGSVIEHIKQDEAKRLVDLGDASFVRTIPAVQDAGGQESEPPVFDESVVEEFKEVYEYAELKKTAAEVGLEFPGNISFKDLVKLIVEQNKVNEFFEDEE